ncbi:MAG: MFS transporter [Trebonia sp.]
MSETTLTPATVPSAPRPRPDPRLTLLACCFSLFMAQLDATAVNVALPSIGTDLGAGISGLQWVVDGYVLVLACLAMTGGGLGDRYGRRRVYRIGLATFSLASLGCSLMPTIVGLVGFRMVQAIGAAMLMPVTLSIVSNTFHEPVARARAIGIWAAAAGVAAGVGPIVGGALASGLGWRAIFWINLPIGALALLLTGRYVPESRAAEPRRPDLIGQAVLAVTLATLTYALIEAPRWGWGSTTTLTILAGAAIGMLCFAVVESRVGQPMIEPRYLRDRRFAGAGGIAVLTHLAVMGFLFLNSLYLQQVRDMSPLAAGAALLPVSLALAAVSPLAGRLTGRYGPRPVLVFASACLIAGLAILARSTPSTALMLLATAYVLIGAGWGLLNPPLTNVAVDTMPRDQAGVASAAVGTSRQLGAVLGVAVMGSLTITLTRAKLRYGPTDPSRLVAPGSGHGFGGAVGTAFTDATHMGYAVGIAAALAALVLAIATLNDSRLVPHDGSG